MADSTIDIIRLVLCSLLLVSFAGVGLYFRSRAAEEKLPDVIKQLWTLGMIFCSGQFYFAVYGIVADTVSLTWYNSIVIFMIYGSWGLSFWLFAVEYKASAISIHIRLRNCSDFCLLFLRKIFWIVATTFVLLLATCVFLDAYYSLNV
jgi:hypothetical protein